VVVTVLLIDKKGDQGLNTLRIAGKPQSEGRQVTEAAVFTEKTLNDVIVMIRDKPLKYLDLFFVDRRKGIL